MGVSEKQNVKTGLGMRSFGTAKGPHGSQLSQRGRHGGSDKLPLSPQVIETKPERLDWVLVRTEL